MPLGPGEFDEPLGLLLVVVCQNTHAVEKLEKEAGYKEADFDFVLQFLRTVGLKHGAGLAYTMPSQPGQVRALMYKVLRVGEGEGQGKAGELKHNAIDRDRVFVPPGWDSWGKIRVLREGFDIEGVSRMWSVDIENGETRQQEDETDGQIPQSTETMYAARISNPKPISAPPPTLEVLHSSDQEFLTEQMARLEVFLAEDAAAKKEQRPTASTRRVGDESGSGASIGERIGPVQFNMGGIQYDADEALRRIKVRLFPFQDIRSPRALTLPRHRNARKQRQPSPQRRAQQHPSVHERREIARRSPLDHRRRSNRARISPSRIWRRTSRV